MKIQSPGTWFIPVMIRLAKKECKSQVNTNKRKGRKIALNFPLSLDKGRGRDCCIRRVSKGNAPLLFKNTQSIVIPSVTKGRRIQDNSLYILQR